MNTDDQREVGGVTGDPDDSFTTTRATPGVPSVCGQHDITSSERSDHGLETTNVERYL